MYVCVCVCVCVCVTEMNMLMSEYEVVGKKYIMYLCIKFYLTMLHLLECVLKDDSPIAQFISPPHLGRHSKDAGGRARS